jgi:hypothetical protein
MCVRVLISNYFSCYNGRVGFASLVSRETSARVYEHIYFIEIFVAMKIATMRI